MQNKTIKASLSIAISLSAGAVGSIFTFSAIPTWYAQLHKPFFTPPNWIFGPVWTILYILMGISLFLIWKEKTSIERNRAMKLFFLQLILNIFWSIIFFGIKSPKYAFIEIILLLLSIIATAKYMFPLSKWASLLLVPYIFWVTFAMLLNFAVFLLN